MVFSRCRFNRASSNRGPARANEKYPIWWWLRPVTSCLSPLAAISSSGPLPFASQEKSEPEQMNCDSPDGNTYALLIIASMSRTEASASPSNAWSTRTASSGSIAPVEGRESRSSATAGSRTTPSRLENKTTKNATPSKPRGPQDIQIAVSCRAQLTCDLATVGRQLVRRPIEISRDRSGRGS